jgi:hypothetical protein
MGSYENPQKKSERMKWYYLRNREELRAKARNRYRINKLKEICDSKLKTLKDKENLIKVKYGKFILDFSSQLNDNTAK